MSISVIAKKKKKWGCIKCSSFHTEGDKEKAPNGHCCFAGKPVHKLTVCPKKERI